MPELLNSLAQHRLKPGDTARPMTPAGIAPLLALLLVACGLWRLFANWPQIWDVWLSDETFYLVSGLQSAPDLMRNIEGGPLYSSFYRVLSLLAGHGDAVQLYQLGGLVAVLIGFFGAGLGVWAASRSLALAIASVALLTLLQAQAVWPRVSFLAMFVLGLGFAALTASRGRFNKTAILSLTCFLASFIRPEYTIALYLSLALVLATLAQTLSGRALREGEALTKGALALSVLGGLSLIWSFPFLKQ